MDIVWFHLHEVANQTLRRAAEGGNEVLVFPEDKDSAEEDEKSSGDGWC